MLCGWWIIAMARSCINHLPQPTFHSACSNCANLPTPMKPPFVHPVLRAPYCCCFRQIGFTTTRLPTATARTPPRCFTGQWRAALYWPMEFDVDFAHILHQAPAQYVKAWSLAKKPTAFPLFPAASAGHTVTSGPSSHCTITWCVKPATSATPNACLHNARLRWPKLNHRADGPAHHAFTKPDRGYRIDAHRLFHHAVDLPDRPPPIARAGENLGLLDKAIRLDATSVFYTPGQSLRQLSHVSSGGADDAALRTTLMHWLAALPARRAIGVPGERTSTRNISPSLLASPDLAAFPAERQQLSSFLARLDFLR